MKESGMDGSKRRHNRLLHRPEKNKIPNTTTCEAVETFASVCLNTFGILPVVHQVELSNNGKIVKVRALVDRRSSLSWIDRSFADQLNLKRVKRALAVSKKIGTKCHDSEFNKVTNQSEDYGNEENPLTIHHSLIIDDRL